MAEKTARKRDELGVTEFEPGPDRLPPGRRVPPEPAGTRPRRSFSCDVEVWNAARSAWWAEVEVYPAWSDWAEEAVREKLPEDEPAATTERVSSKTP